MSGTLLEQAVICLKNGDVIATPTESVFGLSCDPDNAAAVEKLLTLKHRDITKGLILVSDDLSHLLPYIYPLTNMQQQKVLATWPGPVTWLVPKAASLANWISGEHDTVAVRVTAHPLLRQLCAAFGKPLISTSANVSNALPAKTADEVRMAFVNEKTLIRPSGILPCFPEKEILRSKDDRILLYILDGNVGEEARPTQIRDLMTDHILRK